MDSKKKIVWIAGAIAVLLVAIVAFTFIRTSEKRGEDQGRRDIFSPPGSEDTMGETAEEGIEGAKRMLKEYMAWSVYPQTSRPLLKDYEDLIDHSTLKLRPTHMAHVDPVTGKLIPSAFSCLIQPQKHSVIGSDQQVITLWCNRGPDGKFVPVKIVDATLVKSTPLGTQRQPSPNLNDMGENGDEKRGDNVYTMTWKPTPSDWGDMDLTVKLEIPEEKENRVYEMTTGFFSSPRLIAEFTGNFQEKIVDGSLIISAELNVNTPGLYEFHANLFNVSDEPVAINRVKKEMAGGKQWVDFLFYGKIFHDRDVNGPYVLTGLRGERRNLPINPTEFAGKSPEQMERLMQESLNRPEAKQPNHEVMPSWDKQYKTQDYAISDFSNQPYDGPDKRERIKMYEDQIREAETASR